MLYGFMRNQVGYIGCSLLLGACYSYLCLLCTSLFSYFNCSKSTDKSFTEIKKRLEKDVDEVGKIAQNVKAKLEAINRDVLLYSSTAWYTSMFHEAKQPVIMLVL